MGQYKLVTSIRKWLFPHALLAASVLAGLCALVWPDSMLSPNYLFNSDPTLHHIKGQLWMFTTHDLVSEQFERGYMWDNMYDYHSESTTDFRTWVDHGSIFSILDVGWAKGNALWDGDAGIAANGKYYAYAPFDYEIGVLVSDNPAGPYADALGHPLVAKGAKGVTCKLLVSPSVIFDNGVPYLYFGWNGVDIVKLKPNMIELAGPIIKVQAPDDFVESPIITKIKGRYYLTYSNGGMWGEDKIPKPQIKYSIADNILGPYTHPAVLQDIQINPDEQGFKHKYASSAHQGLEWYKGQLYLAYQKDSHDGVHRHVCITKVNVHQDGTLGIIDPNTDRGVVYGPINFVLDAYAPYKREAQEFNSRSGADEEQGIRQDYHFKMKNGGFLRFNHMDFADGPAGYRIAFSCENPALKEGKVEFRLDTFDGLLIGAVPITFTGRKKKLCDQNRRREEDQWHSRSIYHRSRLGRRRERSLVQH